jgi:RNA polymerase sigma-70 factor, ECF subfamily
MDGTLQDRSPMAVESWIVAARQGDAEALGRALSAFREYLLLVAGGEMEPALKPKGGASDLVQDTFLMAQRDVKGFRGQTAVEWRDWLRTILLHQLANHRRQFRAAKRRVGREVVIDDVARDDRRGMVDSPSHDLDRREREAVLLAALERLPDRYREVVVWHNKDRLPFEEVGRRHGVSAEAARKRWTRALARLRIELDTSYGIQ